MTVSPSPRLILDGIYAFPPNRETLGGTAYYLPSQQALIDCPFWEEGVKSFLTKQGGVQYLILTHRGGIGTKVRAIQEYFNCSVIIQEQEAYLLPEVSVTSFEEEYRVNEDVEVIWTCGFSPGSSCVYYRPLGGVLFTGRHLVPDKKANPIPLRTLKTFHWFRQLQNLEKLKDRFSSETLQYLCPASHTGFLRKKGYIDHAYAKIEEIHLSSYKQQSLE